MTDPGPSHASHSIAEFLRAYAERAELLGFRCAKCDFVTATWSLRCPRCGVDGLTEIVLSGRGRVAAYTVQTVPGDEFLNDAPYAYVVVDLEEGGRITGWMPSVRRVEDLAIGDRVHFAGSYRPGVQFAKDQPSATGGTRS